MNVKNQYLLAALCCTIGCVAWFVGKTFYSFWVLFLLAGLIFPQLGKLGKPQKSPKSQSSKIKRVSLASALLLLALLIVVTFCFFMQNNRNVLQAWYFILLVWLLALTILAKGYLVEMEELQEAKKNIGNHPESSDQSR